MLRNEATMSTRRFCIFANWKSSGSLEVVRDLSRALAATSWPPENECEVVVAPSFLHAHALEEGLGGAGRRAVFLGAQDVYAGSGSAHTGETTAEMLRDFGAHWVLVGHSERRHDPLIGGESDECVALKAQRVLSVGLGALVCVGETAEERAAGKATRVITRQLAAVAQTVTQWDKLAFAYEPVWAIGTGMVASLEQVQEMHEAVRSWVRDHVSPTVSQHLRILYGGSVSMDNCEPIAALPDVDGFLVGGAATRLVYAGHSAGVKSEFAEIVCRAVASHHAAACGGGTVQRAPGVVQRGKAEPMAHAASTPAKREA